MSQSYTVDLLATVLQKLKRGDAPDGRWPDPKGDYWPLCPFHADTSSGSFCVGPKGFKCFACGASGSLPQLADRLGIRVARLHANPEGVTPPPPLTLEDYARAKALELGFLQSLGLETVYRSGKPVVKIPYLDREGAELAARLRLHMEGPRRFL